MGKANHVVKHFFTNRGGGRQGKTLFGKWKGAHQKRPLSIQSRSPSVSSLLGGGKRVWSASDQGDQQEEKGLNEEKGEV